jgi:predicted transposase YdaD
MRYVTSIERMGIDKGRQEGLQEGLIEAIELGLELKFGSEGLELLSEISQIQDLEILKAIKTGIKTANNLSEIQQVYQ